MHAEQPLSPNPMEMIERTLGKPLGPGELGALMARAGVGKTACLTHIALEHLLSGQRVLHVCIDGIPDKIKIWYQEFLRNMAANQPGQDVSGLQHRIEPLRFILAYLHQTFSPAKLEQSLLNLEEQAKFHPSLVVLDGLDFDRVPRGIIEELRDFAQKHSVSVWMSARTHRHISIVNERGIPYPCHELDDLFRAIVLLEPLPNTIRVKVLKNHDGYVQGEPEIFLNPQTYFVQRN